MERDRKLRKLNEFRRRLPHCTAAAMAAVLLAVKTYGMPDGDTSRDAFRAGRDIECKASTPYGPILQHMTLITLKDAPHPVPVANPFAVLWSAVSKCGPFAKFLRKRLDEVPPTPEKPWNLILYSDEVTPGNPLAPVNKRKFQAIYWSFIELGPNALSREEAWMTCMLEFSTTVKNMHAGLSQVFGELLKLFFDRDGFDFSTSGINLPFESGNVRLWAKVGAVVQDGGAHKSVWHSRGDGASKACLLCKNMYDSESHICEEDGSQLLICNVLKFADLIRATSRELRNVARHVASQAGILNGDQLTELQQATGITHHHRALLLDRTLDDIIDPVEVYVHDWMHALFVDGIFNLAIFLLFEVFIRRGLPNVYSVFADFLSKWTWPQRIHGSHLAEIFSNDRQPKHRKAKHIKSQASDLLSIVGVIAFFTQTVLMNIPDVNCKAECEAFLALINVIELVVATSRMSVPPYKLLVAVEKFLSLFAASFGFKWMIPKFHWLLHLAKQLQNMGMLLNCFCLERKHRVPKRYAGDIKNMSKKSSESLLMEVICHNLGQLKMPDALNFEIGLVNGRTPSKRLLQLVRERLELDADDEVKVSIESRFNPLATCKEADVVIFNDNGGIRVAQVLLHCEINSVAVTMVTESDLYKHDADLGHSVWTPRGDESKKFIETSSILAAVVYCTRPDGKWSVLLPLEYR